MCNIWQERQVKKKKKISAIYFIWLKKKHKKHSFNLIHIQEIIYPDIWILNVPNYRWHTPRCILPFKKILSRGKCDFFLPHLLYSIDSPYIKMLITYFHFIFIFAKFFRVTFFYLKSGENNNNKKSISEFHISSVVFLLIVTRSKLHRKKLRGKKWTS